VSIRTFVSFQIFLTYRTLCAEVLRVMNACAVQATSQPRTVAVCRVEQSRNSDLRVHLLDVSWSVLYHSLSYILNAVNRLNESLLVQK